MIEVEGVGRRYGPIVALQDVSFRIADGEIVGLLGPNGAGKTTLMRVLTGFFEPSEGRVCIDGIDVLADPKAAQARIGYLPENTPLYPEMLVQEALLMAAEFRGVAPDRRKALLSQAIWATGLEQHLVRPIGALSKGFRQRVGIAQAILHEPKVLVLDEPTSGLDPNQVVEVRALIKRLAESATVLFSTHVLTEVEVLCPRAIVIMGGRLRADARLDELKATGRVVLAVSRGSLSEGTVSAALLATPGVRTVRLIPGRPDAFTFEVEGDEVVELPRRLFRGAVSQGWELLELRPLVRTLESVFRELSQEAA